MKYERRSFSCVLTCLFLFFLLLGGLAFGQPPGCEKEKAAVEQAREAVDKAHIWRAKIPGSRKESDGRPRNGRVVD